MRPRQLEDHAFAGKQQGVMKTYLFDLGKMDYHDAHQFQLDCVNYRLDEQGRPDIFIVTEHPPVFTLGKRGGLDSLTVAEEHVKKQGVGIVQTERGGDITYHGPGQLVVYPIIHLRESSLSISTYVDMLEEVMISCAGDFGVNTVRDERNRGIWVGNNKIGSIGIRVRRGVAFHGLALNVALDFEHFGWIQPCGLAGVGVTSLAAELGTAVDFNEVKQRIIFHLENLFDRQFVSAPLAVITGEAA